MAKSKITRRVTRTQRLEQICALIGADTIKILHRYDGWPGLVSVSLPARPRRVAMHVSTVSSHARKEYEKRFQNPGSSKPATAPPGYLPVLVGLATVGNKSILIAADGRSRLERRRRFSILFHSNLLREAVSSGWAEYTSRRGERIFGFHPGLFPTFVSALISGRSDSIAKDSSKAIADAAMASGLIEDDSPITRERARRSSQVLIRYYAFGQKVKDAYGGRCAMCGLDLGLLVGAHIYPASAPGSSDKVWNGIALCHNHHAAFDNHMIWVHPTNRDIRLRRDLVKAGKTQPPIQKFIDSTNKQLTFPARNEVAPRGEMFKKRYSYYMRHYGWVTRSSRRPK